MAVPVGAVMFLGGVAVAKGEDLSKRLGLLEDPSLAISPKPCNLLGHQTIQSSRDD
jgi:hypothetical protein